MKEKARKVAETVTKIARLGNGQAVGKHIHWMLNLVLPIAATPFRNVPLAHRQVEHLLKWQLKCLYYER